jgi:hypothetical protein
LGKEQSRVIRIEEPDYQLVHKLNPLTRHIATWLVRFTPQWAQQTNCSIQGEGGTLNGAISILHENQSLGRANWVEIGAFGCPVKQFLSRCVSRAIWPGWLGCRASTCPASNMGNRLLRIGTIGAMPRSSGNSHLDVKLACGSNCAHGAAWRMRPAREGDEG